MQDRHSLVGCCVGSERDTSLSPPRSTCSPPMSCATHSDSSVTKCQWPCATFRQDVSLSDVSKAIDTSLHLNHCASHTTAVAYKCYEEDSNSYRARYPHNILQANVDPALANFAVESGRETTGNAFDNPAIFKKDAPKLLDPLPLPLEFIRAQAFSPMLNSKCPVIGCDEEYFYAGDLYEHVKTHKSKGTKLLCPCGNTYPTYKQYKDHLKYYCKKKTEAALYSVNEKRSKTKGPPPGTAYFICSACPGKWFVTEKNAKGHCKERGCGGQCVDGYLPGNDDNASGSGNASD